MKIIGGVAPYFYICLIFTTVLALPISQDQQVSGSYAIAICDLRIACVLSSLTSVMEIGINRTFYKYSYQNRNSNLGIK